MSCPVVPKNLGPDQTAARRRSGISYLVRFDDLIGFTDGSKWPEALAVVAVTDMVGSGDDDKPPPWWFFDNPEQRARYEAWLNEPPTDLKPRVVPLRRGPPDKD